MILKIDAKIPANYCQLIKMELTLDTIKRLSEEYNTEYKELRSLLNREIKLSNQNFNLVTKLVREALKERRQTLPKDV